MCATLVRPTHTATLPHAAVNLDTGSVAAQYALVCAYVRSLAYPYSPPCKVAKNFQSVKGHAPDFSEFAAYMRHGVCLLLAGGHGV